MVWPTEEEKLADRPSSTQSLERIYKPKLALRSFSHSQATNACLLIKFKLVVQDLNAECEIVTEILAKKKTLNTLKVMHVAFKL